MSMIEGVPKKRRAYCPYCMRKREVAKIYDPYHDKVFLRCSKCGTLFEDAH